MSSPIIKIAPPTFAGFQQFVTSIMGVTSANEPNLVYYQWAYQIALDTVNLQLNAASPDLYTVAVYNLAGDNLINYAQDNPSAPVDASGNGFWAALRVQWNVNDLISGVVQSTGDESTNVTLAVPEGLKELTYSQLQNTKTPYGRRYLGIARSVGTMWGLT